MSSTSDRQMTGRERLLALFQGKIPDRMPFVPMMTSYFWGALPEEWAIDNAADACRCVGSDMLDWHVSSYSGWELNDLEWLHSKGIQRRETVKGDITTIELVTPEGTLSERRRETREAGRTSFTLEHLIKGPQDMAPYRYLWAAREPEPAYGLTQESIERIGEDGLVVVRMPPTPIMTLIMRDAGLDTVCYLLADQPQRMHGLLDLMTAKSLALCDIVAQAPVEVAFIAENSGTRLVSPRQFATYCKPVLSEYARILHSHGKIAMLHACGHLERLLEQIADTGVDGIESVTPPPTGNTPLSLARKVLGADKILIGGMDPSFFASAQPEEIEKLVEEIAEWARPGRNYALMPADSCPANAPLANFAAVRRTINRYGRWLEGTPHHGKERDSAGCRPFDISSV